MDRSSGKRGAFGSLMPRKTCNAASFKEAAGEEDHSAQFCNRIGCSGRIKFGQNARIGVSDLSKGSKPSFRSSNANEGTGKSSRTNPTMTSAKRSCLDPKRKLSSRVTSDSSESNERGNMSELRTKSKEVNMNEAGSSSSSLSLGPRNTFRSKSGLSNQSSLPASPVPSASRSSALGPFNKINGSKYGLRNLRCNTKSDAVPPSCPEPENVTKNSIRKRSSEGESSSSYRGRKSTVTVNTDRHKSVSDLAHNSSGSVEDSGGSSSTWNRRLMNSNNDRMRFSSRQDGRNISSVREPAVSSSGNDYETPFDDGEVSDLQQFPVSGSRSHRSRINSDNSSSRTSFASSESGLNSTTHDVLHRFNIDGVAEILMALERIEQVEELTHEQILSLETRLFLSGLNLYDQHRDMRMDIDNMSYEELLALEERMGTVSTAVSEEALSKCLTRSTHEAAPSTEETTDHDIKCSICQEEFVTGDEIGSLVECKHGFHETCINQWLQMKNWCPICKSSAAPSSSSPS